MPDRTLEVPDSTEVAGWYHKAPRPGEVGPAILTAHNRWRGQDGVFLRVHELQPGDEIHVRNTDGSTATFRVERVEQHPKSDFPTQAVYGNVGRPEIRLITCGGPFDPNRRGGSHVDNIIVFGVRVA